MTIIETTKTSLGYLVSVLEYEIVVYNGLEVSTLIGAYVEHVICL